MTRIHKIPNIGYIDLNNITLISNIHYSAHAAQYYFNITLKTARYSVEVSGGRLSSTNLKNEQSEKKILKDTMEDTYNKLIIAWKKSLADNKTLDI